MSKTVKNIINELEKLSNKYLEVEVSHRYKTYEIDYIAITKTKVTIRVKDEAVHMGSFD
jgi:hypothetical protein